MDASAALKQTNTMKRTIDPNSPIWVPILINFLFILITGSIAMYNMDDTNVRPTQQGGFHFLRRLVR